MMLRKIILKIKRREGKFFGLLYDLAKSVRAFNIPCIRPIHLPLYYLDYFVKTSVRWIISVMWSVPLFKARCQKTGRNLRLPNGIPLIIGNHLKICLGDNVLIMRSTIGASKVFDDPVLTIGNNSAIGYGSVLSVAKEVTIGDNCMIAPHCTIMDSDDHPVNPAERIVRMPVSKENVKPVRIGNNVWIGSYSLILKGVTIGDNSVVSAHSVVTKDVMANCVYAGYPARPTLRDIDKL